MLSFAQQVTVPTGKMNDEIDEVQHQIPQWLEEIKREYGISKEHIKQARQDFKKEVKQYKENSAKSPPSQNLVISKGTKIPYEPFIGRRMLLSKIKEFLRQKQKIPAIILGEGGVGKTHLVLEIEHYYKNEAKGTFDEIHFIKLCDIDGYNFLVSVLGQLGVSTSYEGNHLKKLESHVSNRWQGQKRLIIFDDLENLFVVDKDNQTKHLQLEQFYNIVSYLGNNSNAQIKVLITSRHYDLSKLKAKVFEAKGFPFLEPNLMEELETLERHEAIEFAMSLIKYYNYNSNFELNSKTYQHIIKICRLANYVPLVMKVALLHVSVEKSLEEIVRQLEEGCCLLEDREEKFEGHPFNVKGVFEGTLRLFSKREQEVWCQLSILEDGFTEEIAKSVAPDFLSAKENFIKYSLLQPDRQENRYKLHYLHRVFAKEKLEENPALKKTTYKRHALYFSSLAQKSIISLFFPEQLETQRDFNRIIEYLKADIENCKRAWDWFITNWDSCFKNSESHEYTLKSLQRDYRDHNKSTSLCPLSEVFSFYNQLFHRATDSLKFLDKQITCLERKEGSHLLIASLYENKAFCHYRLGELDNGYDAAKKAIELSNKTPSLELVRSLFIQSIICTSKGSYKEAVKLIERGIGISKEINSDLGQALGSQSLIMAKTQNNEIAEAIELGETFLKIYKKIGSWYNYKIAAQYLSEAYLCTYVSEKDSTFLNKAEEILNESDKIEVMEINYTIDLSHPAEQRAKIALQKDDNKLEGVKESLYKNEELYKNEGNEILLIRLYSLQARVALKKNARKQARNYLCDAFEVGLRNEALLIPTLLTHALLESAQFFMGRNGKNQDLVIELLAFVKQDWAPAYQRSEAKNLWGRYCRSGLKEKFREADLLSLAKKARSCLLQDKTGGG